MSNFFQIKLSEYATLWKVARDKDYIDYPEEQIIVFRFSIDNSGKMGIGQTKSEFFAGQIYYKNNQKLKKKFESLFSEKREVKITGHWSLLLYKNPRYKIYEDSKFDFDYDIIKPSILPHINSFRGEIEDIQLTDFNNI